MTRLASGLDFEPIGLVASERYAEGDVESLPLISESGSARATITDVLGRLHRRARANDAIGFLTHGLWGLAALLLLLKLSGLWDVGAARGVILALYAVGLVGILAWHFTRKPRLASSAGLADQRADLKDELKSAWAFMGSSEPTTWTELQIARAAETAGEMDEEAVAPIVVPRGTYAAAGASALLVALLVWNPSWVREASAPALFSLGEGNLASPEIALDEENLLAELPDPDSLEEEEAGSELLRAGELDLAEGIQDLSEVDRALAEASVDIDELRSGLEEFGEQLEASASIADLAEALKSLDPQEAARLLRELAEKMSEVQTAKDLQALLDSLREASEGESAELADLLDSLQNAAGEMSEQSLADAQQALENAANQLEQMGEQMAARQQAGAEGQQPQHMEAPVGDQAAGRQQMGQNQQNQTMEGAAGMAGNQVQLAQLEGAMQNVVPLDAGPGGHSTGEGGEEAVLGEATRLDVQLEMELLQTEEREEPVPDEIFEKQSREEKSNIDYESVRQRQSYTDEQAMNTERIPWQYRSLIKRYFLSIRSSSETSSEK